MFGPLLALFTRSLRTDLRLTRTHVFRLVFALVILFALTYAHGTSLTFAAPGLTFFRPIAWLNLFFISLGGASYFATAISEEKDEATIGLLRMAGISPVALMLGKSTSRLVTALLVLLVQLPFTLLAVTLGGVTANQILAVYAALAAWMVFAANLGLFCSVASSSSARAAGMATLLILACFAVPPAAFNVAGALGVSTSPTWVAIGGFVEETHCAARISAILTTGFSERPRDYLLSRQVLASLGAGLALFGVSWLGFERFTTEAPARGGGAFRGAPRRLLGPGRAWKRALVWKDFHFVAGGVRWLGLRAAGLAVVAGGVAYLEYLRSLGTNYYSADWHLGLVGRSMMGVALAAAAFELSVTASRVFREEAQGRTLAGLLMTPHSTAGVAWSKVAGCLLGLLPAAGCFALGAFIAPEVLILELARSITSLRHWYFGLMFVTFLHLTALLSLIVRWGALPLALVITVFAMSCLFMPIFLVAAPAAMATHSELAAVVPLAGTHCGVCAMLQHLIAARLRDAAEG